MIIMYTVRTVVVLVAAGAYCCRILYTPEWNDNNNNKNNNGTRFYGRENGKNQNVAVKKI